MSAMWPTAPLGQVLKPVERPEKPQPGVSYRQLGVRLWGQGAYEREVLDGAATKYPTLSRVEADDVVVNKIWARNGSTAVVQPELSGCFVSGEFPTFTVDADRLLPRWMHWLTKTVGFWEQCDAKSRGTSGKNRIKPEQFLRVEIPLPPLGEQKRILKRIEVLAAKISQAVRIRRKSVELVDSAVTVRLSEHFDLGPNRDLPTGWKWKPFEALLEGNKAGMATGPFGTLLSKADIEATGVPVLGIANVAANRFVPGFVDFVSEAKAQQLSRYRLQAGDIVVARSGTVGRSCLVPGALEPTPIMSTNLIRLRVNPDVFSADLLCRLLNGSKLAEKHKERECRGSTRVFFTQKILGRWMIPCPPVAEQQKILEELVRLQDSVEKVKHLQRQTAAELDALLPSILDKAFKGEL